jgi:hypothetical protein
MTTDKRAFLHRKDNLLAEVNAYITRVSAAEPYPQEHITYMLRIRDYIEMANADELEKHEAWWRGFKRKAGLDNENAGF